MSRWFRVYAELIDDPKFIKLGPDLRNALLMMWCVASANDGRLPAIEDIAIKFRLSEVRTLKLLTELQHCGFIDDDGTGPAPHNWQGRQFLSDVSSNRVKQFRERRRNVSSTVSETPPDTEQIQSRAETEKIAPDGASTNGKTYAFEHGVIRLTPKDFAKWEKAYSHLDLAAELIAIEPWASQQANWFHAVPGALTKKNRDLKHRADSARAGGPMLPLTRDGDRWPDGIV
jgi:hypothetical protein